MTSYWQADCTTDFLGDTSPPCNGTISVTNISLLVNISRDKFKVKCKLIFTYFIIWVRYTGLQVLLNWLCWINVPVPVLTIQRCAKQQVFKFGKFRYIDYIIVRYLSKNFSTREAYLESKSLVSRYFHGKWTFLFVIKPFWLETGLAKRNYRDLRFEKRQTFGGSLSEYHYVGI